MLEKLTYDFDLCLQSKYKNLYTRGGKNLQKLKLIDRKFQFTKPYQPSDPTYAIDWKILARTDQLLVRTTQNRCHRNTVEILVDNSRSMMFPDKDFVFSHKLNNISKFEISLKIAINIAYNLLMCDEKSIITVFDFNNDKISYKSILIKDISRIFSLVKMLFNDNNQIVDNQNNQSNLNKHHKKSIYVNNNADNNTNNNINNNNIKLAKIMQKFLYLSEANYYRSDRQIFSLLKNSDNFQKIKSSHLKTQLNQTILLSDLQTIQHSKLLNKIKNHIIIVNIISQLELDLTCLKKKHLYSARSSIDNSFSKSSLQKNYYYSLAKFFLKDYNFFNNNSSKNEFLKDLAKNLLNKKYQIVFEKLSVMFNNKKYFDDTYSPVHKEFLYSNCSMDYYVQCINRIIG